MNCAGATTAADREPTEAEAAVVMATVIAVNDSPTYTASIPHRRLFTQSDSMTAESSNSR